MVFPWSSHLPIEILNDQGEEAQKSLADANAVANESLGNMSGPQSVGAWENTHVLRAAESFGIAVSWDWDRLGSWEWLTVCELEAMAIESLWVFPSKMVVFHSYVSLPESTYFLLLVDLEKKPCSMGVFFPWDSVPQKIRWPSPAETFFLYEEAEVELVFENGWLCFGKLGSKN